MARGARTSVTKKDKVNQMHARVPISCMTNEIAEQSEWHMSPGARPMQEDWVFEIKTQCVKGKIPFFFKQWGGVNKKKAGRELLGRTWDEMPKKS